MAHQPTVFAIRGASGKIASTPGRTAIGQNAYRHIRNRLAATSVVDPVFFAGRFGSWLGSCQLPQSKEFVMLSGMNRVRVNHKCAGHRSWLAETYRIVAAR